MVSTSKTEIPLNYWCNNLYNKIHIIDRNNLKGLFLRPPICNNIQDAKIHRSLNQMIKICSYNEICKNCLKKLPPDILEKVKYNFILAKLKNN